MLSTADTNKLHGLLSEANGLVNQQRYSKARKVCEQALALAPESPDAYMIMAAALEGRGDVTGAINAYRKAVECDPKHLASWVNLGVCQRERQHFMAAVDAFERAAEIDPNALVVRYNLARAYYDGESYPEAIANFKKALQQRPGWAEVCWNIGAAYLFLEEIDTAIEWLQKAIEQKPDLGIAYAQLGYAYSTKGEFDRAEETLRRALEVQPTQGMAHLTLARGAKPEEQEAADLAAVVAALATPDLTRRSLADLNYAAYWLFNRKKDHEKAFHHITEANRVRREDYPSNVGLLSQENIARLVEGAQTHLTKDYFDARNGRGNQSETPVFVVGMPRSGTTLVEQIVSSHPQGLGAGELNTMLKLHSRLPDILKRDFAFPAQAAELTDAELELLAAQYFETHPEHGPDVTRVVDKAPLNLFLIGFIKTILPNAKFVMCRRSAMDTCWSCYTAGFGPGLVRFAQNFETLGQTYSHGMTLMQHWSEVLPDDTLIFDYQALIDDFEPRARGLIEFLGLPWDDACLSFHETDRAINTASFWQVRQPLYKTAHRQWEPYSAHLDPLREALGPFADG